MKINILTPIFQPLAVGPIERGIPPPPNPQSFSSERSENSVCNEIFKISNTMGVRGGGDYIEGSI